MSEVKMNRSVLEQYDVCMFTMFELNHDARTLNIARTLVKNAMNVCIIGFGNDDDEVKYQKENIKFIGIKKLDFKRAYKKWLYFNKICKKYLIGIKSKAYWASDFFSLSLASKFSKTYSSKFYYDAREIYSAIGSLHERKLTQLIQTFLEKHWVKNVDKIVVTGEMDKEYLMEHFDFDIPYIIIKNFPKEQKHIESNLLREKFNIAPDKKILIYQGMLSEGRGILPCIKTLGYLDDCVLCLLGDGDLKHQARNLALEIGVDDKLFFTGSIDYDELHKWTCSADVGICIIEPISYSYKLALPNKLFEYCMAEIPCVASNLPAMRKVIDEFGIGITVSEFSSPEELAVSISTLLQKENYLKFKNSCREASSKLSFDSQEELVMSVFKEL